jgi:hypothetical protein
LLSRAFRRRRRISEEFKNHELDELLWAKWLDPIGASLAVYESVRRGQLGAIPEVARNMTQYFRDLPDTAAIARLAGIHDAGPRGVPLFLDGLRAFTGGPETAGSRSQDLGWLPFAAHLLDFTGPWTAWRGAVKVR